MKRLLTTLLAIVAVLCTEAQQWRQLMDAGLNAYRRKDYNAAALFSSSALAHIPTDSLNEIYALNQRMQLIKSQQNNYSEAIRYGQKCIDIIKTEDPGNTSFLKEAYFGQANIYSLSGDSALACRYVDSLLALSREDTNVAFIHQTAIMAGIIYAHLNNWETAEECYDLAEKCLRSSRESDETLTTLNLYANSLYKQGKYAEAEPVYQRQLDMAGRLYGENSEKYVWAKYQLANIKAFKGDTIQGSRLYRDAAEWYCRTLRHKADSVTPSERQNVLGEMITLVQRMVPYAMEAKYLNNEFTLNAYNGLLLTKGLLLAAERSASSIIRTKGSVEDRRLLDDVIAVSNELDDAMAAAEPDVDRILTLYTTRNMLEQRLARSYQRLGNVSEFASVGFEDVRNSLRDDEVLLDFYDYKPASKPRQFVCFEIRRDSTFPRLHHICDGAQLDSLLAAENNIWSNLYDAEAGEAMKEIVAAPLRSIIGDAGTVYYVPSGAFHRLAIEAIPCGDGIMGDAFAFRRLSSARELIPTVAPTPRCSATLYGGLDYSIGLPEEPANGLGRLSGSLKEVEDIAADISSVLPVVKFTGSEGTEESFYTFDGSSPDILHLSTHGYYYDPGDKNRPETLQGYNDALSLSGLLMAGGNAGWLGIVPNRGMLSGRDISSCDLSHTSLACIASCHSGDGLITPEGIYGLERAFKKAGAGSLLLCMWTASDVAAQCFMTAFYHELIHGSGDRHKAFEHARDSVRRRYRAPYYWAGFIMVD